MRHRTRPQIVTTAVLVALSGAITGLAAAGHVGPFASLGAQAQQHTVAAQLPNAPLRADSLFPPPTAPPAVHEVIVVADPAQPAASSAGTPTASPTSPPTSAPSPTASPTPTPCYDDCGGDGGGGGGGGDN